MYKSLLRAPSPIPSAFAWETALNSNDPSTPQCDESPKTGDSSASSRPQTTLRPSPKASSKSPLQCFVHRHKRRMRIGSEKKRAKGSLAKSDEVCSIYQSCNRRSSMSVAAMEGCGRCLDLTMESFQIAKWVRVII